MDDANILAVQAAEGECALNELISQQESFILRCAASEARRYVTKSDDEWSVALTAFSQAVRDYDPAKGAFLPFAALVIRRRIVDYLRSQTRYHLEIPVSPTVFASGPEEDGEQPALQTEVTAKMAVTEQNDLRLEIEAANACFSSYGFSFFDLSTCSPKTGKTRTACTKAVAFLLRNPLLIDKLRETGLLPIQLLEKNAQVPRKILERHRKYIIAAVEMLSGEYPALAEYLRFIREELDK